LILDEKSASNGFTELKKDLEAIEALRSRNGEEPKAKPGFIDGKRPTAESGKR
jgi:hypothetical protein